MARPSYVLAREAEHDLLDIAHYTKIRWGLQQQRSYISGLYDLFARIAEEPMMGAARPDLGTHARVRLFRRSHAVYYDHEDGRPIAILRVLHVRQDAEAAFD